MVRPVTEPEEFSSERELGVSLDTADHIGRLMPGLMSITKYQPATRRVVVVVKPLHKFWQLCMSTRDPERVQLKLEPTIMIGRIVRTIVPYALPVSRELQIFTYSEGVKQLRVILEEQNKTNDADSGLQ
jgi:hypothetical protein